MRGLGAGHRQRLWFALLVVAVTAVFGGMPGRAVDATALPAPTLPGKRVKVGIFVTQLYDFDLPRRSFNIAFWAWFLHPDPAYKPLETVEIPNAKSMVTRYPSVTRKEGVLFNGVRTGLTWDLAKYYATIAQEWDVARYPFDRQVLTFNLEDTGADANSLVLEADDLTPSALDATVKVPGWSIAALRVRAEPHLYKTDYGDPTLDGTSTFSRIVAEIVIKRDGWRLLSSMFVGFFVAFVLSSASYMLEASGAIANARVGLSGGAIFAAVGNKYIIDNNLPPSSHFTLADGIEASSFLAILFAILVSVAVMQLKPKRPDLAARVNRTCGVGSVAVYLLFNAALIARATT